MHSTAPDTSHLLRQLVRGLPIILGCAVLVGALALWLSDRQSPSYLAATEVFIDVDQIGPAVAELQLGTSDPDRALSTQAAVARVPEVLRRAARAAPEAQITPGQLSGDTAVNKAADADILTFSANAGTPQMAVRLANAYAAAYVDYRRDLDTALLRRALADATAQLATLRRQGRGRSIIYGQLEARQQELRQRTELRSSAATIGRPAAGASQTQPKTTRNVLLGVFLGVLLGIALALLRTTLNTRIRSSAEVEALLELPLLGRLPAPDKRLRQNNRLVMLEDASDPSAEGYRMLGTNIELVNLDRGAKTIMVTSATVAEGKSTTIANIAVSLARSGSRVALVDLDLRRPALHTFFGHENRIGLSDVTLRRVALDQALVDVELRMTEAAATDGSFAGSLKYLPTGLCPPNPAEFIRSGALDAVLEGLAEEVDLVLVDSPPLLHFSDGMTLTGKVDALIAAVRISTIRQGQLRELRRLLSTAPVVKLGFFATDSDETDDSGGYGYSGTYAPQAAPATGTV